MNSKKKLFVRRIFRYPLCEACRLSGIDEETCIRWLGKADVQEYANEVGAAMHLVTELQAEGVRATATGALIASLGLTGAGDLKIAIEVLKLGETLKPSGTIIDEGWDKVLARLGGEEDSGEEIESIGGSED